MKKAIILLTFLLSFVGLYSQTVTLSFTGRGRGGVVSEEIYQQIDSLQVSNITRHWQQMIYYPDTIVMMEPLAVPMISVKQSGLEQNVPNPFDCVTEACLNLSEADRVSLRVFDAVGKECLSYDGKLPAGEHRFEITLALPQTYMLTAVTSTGKYSVKMVNLGTCGTNSIMLKSSSDVEVRSKDLISNEFHLGDQMEYLAFTTYNGLVFDASQLQEQNGSEDITIHFNIPYCTYSINVDYRYGCGSFTWINGVTYTETNHNAATMRLTSAGGCDSVVLLDLTIDDHFEIEETITSCEPIYWNGQYCSASGQYIADLISQGGCDSTVVLTFRRVNNVEHHIYSSDCESVSWNGEIFTETGAYVRTFPAQYGCDSIVTLHFTRLSDDTVVNVYACDEFTWINGRTYYGSNNTDTVHLINQHGCDSIVRLNLTLNHSGFSRTDMLVCGSFVFNGSVYSTSGVYTETLDNPYTGCDSVVELHLTIIHDTITDMYESACESFTYEGQTYTESGVHYIHYHPNDYCDSVLRLHLEIAHHTYATQNAEACDSYTWFGEEYTTSGTYHHTLMNSQGCDSIITLNLTIKHSVENDKTINACRSYDLNGERITESCTRVITYTAANGCDSTVTYHINIFGDIETEFTQYACGSFQWQGETFTQSNDYVRHITPVLYCDSVVTMHLFIGSPDATEIVQTACGSYTWDGRTYTESGNYPYTYRNIYGCDSVVTLRLTVNPVYSNIHDVQTACDSYEWEGDIYTQGGSFTKTLHTVAGCDSVVTLDLTIKYSVEHEFSDTAWGPYDISDGSAYATFRSLYLNNRPDTLGPYMWNDSVYTRSGDYQQTFVAANGCDSVVTLHLVYHEIVYDTRDGNVYYTLEYGNQVWTTENMRYLPQVVGVSSSTNSTSASYYFVYNFNDTIIVNAKNTLNYKRYGTLYNFAAAQTACPAGWRLPTKAEWQELVAYLGSNGDYTCNAVSANVAKSMASVLYWNTSTTTCAVGNDLEQNNASGFNGMPGGYKNSTGFTAISDEAVFWSSTTSGSSSQRLQLAKGQATVSISLKNKAWGFNVRCVKDNE